MSESRITRHVKLRAEERFGLLLNRQARVDIVNIIRSQKSRIFEVASRNRIKLIVPIFLSRSLCNQNHSVQFGDWVICIYDIKVMKIITLLPFSGNDVRQYPVWHGKSPRFLGFRNRVYEKQ